MGTEECGCEKKPENHEESLSSSGVNRRNFIANLLMFTGIAFLASLLSPLRMLIPPKIVEKETAEVDNTFKYAKVDGTWFSEKAGKEVETADFETGMGAAVIWRKTIPAILIKLDPSRLSVTEGIEQGFAAYCAKCTHLCCIANWHIDRPDMDMIFCRCHDGVLDPYNIVEETDEKGNPYFGAQVVSGPIPSAIPLIPVEIQEGKVMGIPSDLEWYNYC